MKKTLSIIASVLFTVMTLSTSANAATYNPLKEKDSKAIITTFIETITSGSDLYNKYLFTADFEYKNSANNHQFTKSQYLGFLKQTKGFKYNCETEYQILDEVGKSCVAKAIMRFENFTRVDYITLNKTDEGWKVSKVVTTYP